MHTKAKILLVDDEVEFTSYLTTYLEHAGLAVATAADGEAALRQVSQFKPDLIVLDIAMPGMDGREVLRQLRRSGNWTPVILLSKYGGSDERSTALAEEGADEYLIKPFEPSELLARIKAMLRRVQIGQKSSDHPSELTCGELVLNRGSRRVHLAGREVNLSPKAITLLEYLMAHPNEVLLRQRLLDNVWGDASYVSDRAVDVRIRELRRELGDDRDNPRFIETVHTQGYRFLCE